MREAMTVCAAHCALADEDNYLFQQSKNSRSAHVTGEISAYSAEQVVMRFVLLLALVILKAVNVRFWRKADITTALSRVRFRG